MVNLIIMVPRDGGGDAVLPERMVGISVGSAILGVSASGGSAKMAILINRQHCN